MWREGQFTSDAGAPSDDCDGGLRSNSTRTSSPLLPANGLSGFHWKHLIAVLQAYRKAFQGSPVFSGVPATWGRSCHAACHSTPCLQVRIGTAECCLMILPKISYRYQLNSIVHVYNR